MNNVLTILYFILGFILGGLIGKGIYQPKHPLRVSVAAIQEISHACMGNYRDLAANRKYVYANCVRPMKPVTVENYILK